MNSKVFYILTFSSFEYPIFCIFASACNFKTRFTGFKIAQISSFIINGKVTYYCVFIKEVYFFT